MLKTYMVRVSASKWFDSEAESQADAIHKAILLFHEAAKSNIESLKYDIDSASACEEPYCVVEPTGTEPEEVKS